MSSIFTSKKYYPVLLLVAGIVVALYLLGKISPVYHISKSVPADGEDNQSSVPEADIVLTGFKLVETDGTAPSCKLNADWARIYQLRQIVQLNNVKADLYNDKGQVLSIAGKTGEVNLQTLDMTLRGSIKGTSAEGLKFSTEYVQWSKRDDKLTGPAPVDIHYKNAQISAQRLETDPKTGKLILSGGVETFIRG